ncbi:DddA-like double-stranded DNA deaminase toxin [Amycolatopsis sp. NPDC004079]
MAINNPQVCTELLSCKQAVPAILPKGSILYVRDLDAGAPVELAGKASL